MATRSTIALEYADGTIGQVYCHWDGYLEHNGAMLSNYYSNPFILRDLIDLGDVSSLKPTIGTQHAFGYHGTDMDGETYDKLYGNMCTFYGRDRGEEGTGAKTFIDFQDYMVRFQHEEYAYILRKDGVWYVKQHANEFEPLAEALSKCNQEECVA